MRVLTGRRRAVGLALGLTVGVAACGGGASAYPQNVQTNYLNSCEANGGNPNTCGCTLNWMQSHVSFTQFQADEDQVRTASIPTDLKSAIGACA